MLVQGLYLLTGSNDIFKEESMSIVWTIFLIVLVAILAITLILILGMLALRFVVWAFLAIFDGIPSERNGENNV